jgi:hypothetical protein
MNEEQVFQAFRLLIIGIEVINSLNNFPLMRVMDLLQLWAATLAVKEFPE